MGTFRLRVLAAICALGVGCGVTAAAALSFHPSYEAALKAAKESGRLLMVVVEGPGKTPQGVEVRKLFRETYLGSPQVAEVIGQHFAPFILDIPKVNARKQRMPPIVKYRQFNLPMVLIYDAEGKELAKHTAPFARPQEYAETLKKLTEGRTSPQAKPPDAGPDSAAAKESAARAWGFAQKAHKKRDLVGAMAALKVVLKGGLEDDDQLEAARLMATEINDQAEELLDAADALEGDAKLGSAIRKYRQCIRDYHGTESAPKAAKCLNRLRDDLDLRKRLVDHMARKLLAKAQADARAERYAAAAKTLDQILERYPQAKAAADAKTLRERLAKDPASAGAVREGRIRADAERMLSLARTLRLNRRIDKAIEQYELVIKKYPGTRFARTAAERIR